MRGLALSVYSFERCISLVLAAGKKKDEEKERGNGLVLAQATFDFLNRSL